MTTSELLEPLETVIRSQFISALTWHTPPGDLVRELLALPAQLGGMGLINPAVISTEQHATSKIISAPLVEHVLRQDHQLIQCHAAQQDINARAHSDKRARHVEEARNLQTQLPAPLQRCMDLSQEKGALTWLWALFIDNHGFALHKSAFRDALSLRYD